MWKTGNVQPVMTTASRGKGGADARETLARLLAHEVVSSFKVVHSPRIRVRTWGVPGRSLVGSWKLRSKAHLRVGGL